MLKHLLVVLFILSGCTHTITLYPRAGGERASGTVNDGLRKMTVLLNGETYTGSYILEQSTGVGIINGNVATVTSNTSNASALLTSKNGILRCNFQIISAQGGSGTCTDGENNDVYDITNKVNRWGGNLVNMSKLFKFCGNI